MADKFRQRGIRRGLAGGRGKFRNAFFLEKILVEKTLAGAMR